MPFPLPVNFPAIDMESIISVSFGNGISFILLSTLAAIKLLVIGIQIKNKNNKVKNIISLYN